MKTMLLASAAVFGLAIGSAHADDGDSVEPNTTFTSVPGVVAMPPQQTVAQETIAQDRAYAAAQRQQHGTWLFPAG